jgi:hydrogenase-1 operon protein HyaE
MSQKFSGLLDRLVAKHGMTDLDEAGFQAFFEMPGQSAVLFTEEPDKAAESWDLAVIFPDLISAAGGNLRAGVLRIGEAGKIQSRFGINRLPALLFLRDGAYVGVIEGLRDWSDFVAEFTAMLQKPAGRAPGIGIAVTADASSCH